MQLRILKILGFSVAALLFNSCQTGHELHYFKSGDNYYRLNIKEKSFASKARYMSGFYNDKAVDRYFGEMSQPVQNDTIKARDVQFFKTNVADYAPDQLRIDSNKKLVMILSTNSNAISEQIGAFAENDRILETIMRLNNRDKIRENSEILTQIDAAKKRNQSTVALGTAFIEGLNDSASANNVRSQMSTFLQYLKQQSPQNAPAAELLIGKFKTP